MKKYEEIEQDEIPKVSEGVAVYQGAHHGMVESIQRSAASSLSTTQFPPSEMASRLRTGLPVWELDDLQVYLGVSLERLPAMLGISKATLHRRKAGKRLAPSESDRVVRFARLMSKAVEVFGNEANARQWLSTPQVGLAGAIPLEYAESEFGAREIEDLLGRIEHSVYS